MRTSNRRKRSIGTQPRRPSDETDAGVIRAEEVRHHRQQVRGIDGLGSDNVKVPFIYQSGLI